MSETSYRQRRFQPPPGATEILLVRHGESAPEVPGQVAPQVDGHGDPALAPGATDKPNWWAHASPTSPSPPST